MLTLVLMRGYLCLQKIILRKMLRINYLMSHGCLCREVRVIYAGFV